MDMLNLAQGLADTMGLGIVSHVETDTMDEHERGFSGAEVIRRRVFLADGTDTSMIFKSADRKERCAMKLLTEQKQCSPACYSDDTVSDEPKWMAMEDLGRPKFADPCDELWLTGVSECLASIHSANMKNGSGMPWLPVADDMYWQNVVTGLSVDHFERKMAQSTAFDREFGKYLPGLREEGKRFAEEMSALSRERDCLTLTHGDLQMRDGAHIYCCDGSPRIIDFGFCRYAPFYIDLAGWFARDDLKLYYNALCKKGLSLKYADFEERALAAFRYSGFIYLCPCVMDWKDGSTEQTGKRLLQALHIILNGDFPERRRDYSNGLFLKMLAEHRL